MKNIKYWYVCHRGLRRKINQDNIFVPGNGKAVLCPEIDEVRSGFVETDIPANFAVFDGMGGEQAGEVASYLCADHMGQYDFSHHVYNELSEFCIEANRLVVKYADDHGLFSMGTTAAIVGTDGEMVTVCNLGDSRIYRIRDNTIDRLSMDHSIGFDSNKKSPLYQYIGIPENETLIEPHIVKHKYCENDYYLLCSDGLTDLVSETKIKDIVNDACEKGRDGSAITDVMLNEALNSGGRDNISIILLKLC